MNEFFPLRPNERLYLPSHPFLVMLHAYDGYGTG